MELDAIFRIASMTKPITAVAIMTLYEEGYFTLNTPISEFIPGFQDVKVFVRENRVWVQPGYARLDGFIRVRQSRVGG